MATPLPVPPLDQPDTRTREVTDALNPSFLALVGWDWDLRVVFFPKSHPVLGMPDCRIEGCAKATTVDKPLCLGCHRRWKDSGLPIEDFVTLPRTEHFRAVGHVPCLVPGCERPRKTVRAGLCNAHHGQREGLGIPVEEYMRLPQARPLASFGVCQVVACYFQRQGPVNPYCRAHYARLRNARLDGTLNQDEATWQRTTAAVAVNREASMRGLPDRLVAELLYFLQVRTAGGSKTVDHQLRRVCDRLRAAGTPCLETLSDAGLAEQLVGLGGYGPALLGGARTAVRRLGLTPETERHKDIWELSAFGHRGRLFFTRIHQRPLREAMKIWAGDVLPKRRGKQARNSVQVVVNAVGVLSESLRLQREDGGHTPALLGRPDIVDFCNRAAFLADSGSFSAYRRVHIIRDVRQVLTRFRTLGLTRAGEVLEGLPADFMLDQEDVPDEPEDGEAGRDLPDEVMRQLCANLDLLEESSNREVRVATELVIDTGRRPEEICELGWDCLARDPDGSLILVYDNFKGHRQGRRLPIGKATAAVITAQQERVRQRYPDRPVSELRLLPRRAANPDGRKPIADLSEPHRAWVNALPEFLVPVVVETDGRPMTVKLPFDKARIFPYAYRHTYAQRHADASVAPDVLQALMDHRQMSTTEGYYRVGQERKREAVDRVTALQFDRHGNRVWRKVQGLLDSEHVRRAIGEVATAYGVCLEPSNVAAGGHACPLRFRCIGCNHFRTDVSYLPDLERYLADLLRSRERLMSAFEADDWARSEAVPSEEEIRRVRRLITRVKADLDDLTPEDRAQIEDAVTVVRRGRTVMLGLPKVRQPLLDIRPWSAG
ncbi:tyrosine-type recombinase/integrase [Streptomyces sp. XY431]|uniref:tyrosine-type recombinase/integrase n=1 Tax=Streptomyces sp. XY431 TaxID=1415562 RepID=UPI000B091AA6|nr:tyrosine-type recombinase/integrase [Streptomyces sp. XY431]